MILLVLMVISLYAIQKGSVVSEKNIDGVHILLVKVNAEVLPNIDADTNRQDGTKSLVFYKLDGTIGLSKDRYTSVPNEHNKHVTIYYIEKDDEKNKHKYRVFFNKEDVLFANQENISVSNNNRLDSLDKITETGKEKHFVRDLFQNDSIYFGLFILFLLLNHFFYDNTILKRLDKKVNYALQIILILIFLFGGEHIIRTEKSECYSSPYVTLGRVDYFIDEPYVNFVDCYGHKSKSERKNPELHGKAKNESVTIYYNHDTMSYYTNEDTNVYRVFTSKEAYENGTKTPIRFYFGLLMLFIFVYNYFYNKNKKLYLPSLFSGRESKIYRYEKEPETFDQLLKLVNKKPYSIESLYDYFIDPVISTDKDNRITIERYKLFDVLLPGLVGLGLLWAFSKVFFGVSDKDISQITRFEFGIMIAFGFFSLLSLYIAFTNLKARKTVEIFDINSRTYISYLENKTVLFSDIYGYTITHRYVRESATSSDGRGIRKIELFKLNIVLNSGETFNLYARNADYKKLLTEAKIIAAYTNKPIYDFGKIDTGKTFGI